MAVNMALKALIYDEANIRVLPDKRNFPQSTQYAYSAKCTN